MDFKRMFVSAKQPAYRFVVTVLFFLLVPLASHAGLSGPTTDSDGRYTINISAPISTGPLQFQSHYLRVYRNNAYHKSVNISRTATSFTDVVDHEGQWRYDQIANFRQCIFYIGGECGEWDESTGNVGSHTVTVSFAQSPPPDTGLPNQISGPANSDLGAIFA